MRKVEVIPGDHLANLESCGGVYRAVIDPITQRVVTPLVGYAGKYETPEGLKAYVGNVYFNFAMAEGNPEVLGEFANCLKRRVEDKLNCQVDCVLGAPMVESLYRTPSLSAWDATLPSLRRGFWLWRQQMHVSNPNSSLNVT